MAPSDAQLTSAIQNAVGELLRTNHVEEITVNRVRALVESKLKLQPGFLKADTRLKDKSKALIHAEFAAQSARSSSLAESAGAHVTTKKRKRNRTEEVDAAANYSITCSGPSSPAESALSGQSLNHGDRVSPSQTRRATRHVDADPAKQVIRDDAEGQIDSESDMSEVLDQEPVRKKSERPAPTRAEPKKAKRTGESRLKDASNLDPQLLEIKRLQSNLLKCGVRKLWHKELAGYDTPKAKINHLRKLLADVGMTGRFSEAKARQIKAERELKAESLAVQDFATRWGQVSEDEEDEQKVDGSKVKQRRLAKGLRELDFLGDVGGEETD